VKLLLLLFLRWSFCCRIRVRILLRRWMMTTECPNCTFPWTPKRYNVLGLTAYKYFVCSHNCGKSSLPNQKDNGNAIWCVFLALFTLNSPTPHHNLLMCHPLLSIHHLALPNLSWEMRFWLELNSAPIFHTTLGYL